MAKTVVPTVHHTILGITTAIRRPAGRNVIQVTTRVISSRSGQERSHGAVGRGGRCPPNWPLRKKCKVSTCPPTVFHLLQIIFCCNILGCQVFTLGLISSSDLQLAISLLAATSTVVCPAPLTRILAAPLVAVAETKTRP